MPAAVVARVHGQGKSRGRAGVRSGGVGVSGGGSGGALFFYGDERRPKKKGKRSDIARVSPSSSKLSSDVSDRFRKRKKPLRSSDVGTHRLSSHTFRESAFVAPERCGSAATRRVSRLRRKVSPASSPLNKQAAISHSRDLGSSPHWMAIFFGSGASSPEPSRRRWSACRCRTPRAAWRSPCSRACATRAADSRCSSGARCGATACPATPLLSGSTRCASHRCG